VLNKGNIARTAVQMGINRETLGRWLVESEEARRDAMAEELESSVPDVIQYQSVLEGEIVGQGPAVGSLRPTLAKEDFAAVWGDVERAAVAVIRRRLDHFLAHQDELTPRDLRDLAVAAGIAADKRLDNSEGRSRSGSTVVDRRQETVIVEWVRTPRPGEQVQPIDSTVLPTPPRGEDM
jgi:hypothetical protein